MEVISNLRKLIENSNDFIIIISALLVLIILVVCASYAISELYLYNEFKKSLKMSVKQGLAERRSIKFGKISKKKIFKLF